MNLSTKDAGGTERVLSVCLALMVTRTGIFPTVFLGVPILMIMVG